MDFIDSFLDNNLVIGNRYNSFENLNFNFLPFVIKKIYHENDSNIILVFETSQKADKFAHILEQIDSNIKILNFPSYPIFPYEFNDIPTHIGYERVKCCNSFFDFDKKVIITSIYATLYPTIEPDNLAIKKLKISKDIEIDRDEFIQKLIDNGYNRVKYLERYGEFSVRGEIIDIYNKYGEDPVRLVFFDNYIEEIKTFELESNKIIEKFEETWILPASEYQIRKQDIDTIIKNLYDSNMQNEDIEHYINDLNSNKIYANLWSMTNQNCEKSYIYNYIKSSDIIISFANENFLSSWNEEVKAFDIAYNDLDINGLSHHRNILYQHIGVNSVNCYKVIEISEYKSERESINLKILEATKFNNNIDTFRITCKQHKKYDYDVYIASEEYDLKRLKILLKGLDVKYAKLPIKNGFTIEPIKKIVYGIDDLIVQKIKQHGLSKDKFKLIENQLDIKEGDYVVHLTHGVGKYQGIKRLTILEEEKDYLQIKYKNNEEIYVPLENIGMLQKFIGFGKHKPKLDAVGGKTWNKTVAKTKKQIFEYAEELYDLYKERKKMKGISFSIDDEIIKDFESKFPYEETYDQIQAIKDVKYDMEQPYPMDRLICGDVGFGKTEVAIRAAFKAINDGYQVAFLAPTTVLAQQHYDNILERMKDYPIKVGMLSRLVERVNQRQVLKEFETGMSDILIGTHRLLSKDVRFARLGLLIVDEEQKFGVEAKERLKLLKEEIDVLSLSATPIPRTLYLSLMKVRPVSIINTAPENRQPIEVSIAEATDQVINYAIKQELKRDGKVFIIHNRVKTISLFTENIKNIAPDGTKAAYIHGRMNKSTIKKIIIDFEKGRYNVLVSTTIIESGIDIPNVNTIIIDRADRFGLSNLYQLKGRVGRRKTKAYAYLLYNPSTVITEVAMKRLQVISEYSELGSGYKIALKDLEIRGAGNILGKEQSGFIENVGFIMYQQLLDEAITELKNEKKKNIKKTEIDIRAKAYIPDEYIIIDKEKISIYRKIYELDDREDLDLAKVELERMYGKYPKEVENLFLINELRVLAQERGISRIFEVKDNIIIIFDDLELLNYEILTKYMQKQLLVIKPEYRDRVFLDNDFMNSKEKISYLRSIIQNLWERQK